MRVDPVLTSLHCASEVAQRTHEIGIRLALGAQIRDVRRMIVTQGMVLAVIGAA